MIPFGQIQILVVISTPTVVHRPFLAQQHWSYHTCCLVLFEINGRCAPIREVRAGSLGVISCWLQGTTTWEEPQLFDRSRRVKKSTFLRWHLD